eukprot:Awhi_evm2s15626
MSGIKGFNNGNNDNHYDHDDRYFTVKNTQRDEKTIKDKDDDNDDDDCIELAACPMVNSKSPLTNKKEYRRTEKVNSVNDNYLKASGKDNDDDDSHASESTDYIKGDNENDDDDTDYIKEDGNEDGMDYINSDENDDLGDCFDRNDDNKYDSDDDDDYNIIRNEDRDKRDGRNSSSHLDAESETLSSIGQKMESQKVLKTELDPNSSFEDDSSEIDLIDYDKDNDNYADADADAGGEYHYRAKTPKTTPATPKTKRTPIAAAVFHISPTTFGAHENDEKKSDAKVNAHSNNLNQKVKKTTLLGRDSSQPSDDGASLEDYFIQKAIRLSLEEEHQDSLKGKGKGEKLKKKKEINRGIASEKDFSSFKTKNLNATVPETKIKHIGRNGIDGFHGNASDTVNDSKYVFNDSDIDNGKNNCYDNKNTISDSDSDSNSTNRSNKERKQNYNDDYHPEVKTGKQGEKKFDSCTATTANAIFSDNDSNSGNDDIIFSNSIRDGRNNKIKKKNFKEYKPEAKSGKERAKKVHPRTATTANSSTTTIFSDSDSNSETIFSNSNSYSCNNKNKNNNNNNNSDYNLESKTKKQRFENVDPCTAKIATTISSTNAPLQTSATHYKPKKHYRSPFSASSVAPSSNYSSTKQSSARQGNSRTITTAAAAAVATTKNTPTSRFQISPNEEILSSRSV